MGQKLTFSWWQQDRSFRSLQFSVSPFHSHSRILIFIEVANPEDILAAKEEKELQQKLEKQRKEAEKALAKLSKETAKKAAKLKKEMERKEAKAKKLADKKLFEDKKLKDLEDLSVSEDNSDVVAIDTGTSHTLFVHLPKHSYCYFNMIIILHLKESMN